MFLSTGFYQLWKYIVGKYVIENRQDAQMWQKVPKCGYKGFWVC